MRVANLAGRAVLLTDAAGGSAIDVAEASGGRFGPSPRAVYENWEAFCDWASDATRVDTQTVPVDRADLGPVVPDPRQIFAIGLNYRDHADEAKLGHPEHLVVFTKFASSLVGPAATVELPSGNVDYETELVVVISHETHRVDEAGARAAIAGYTIGQDLSERVVQSRGPAPQFSLGKSYPGFSPTGPAVVTLDELADPDALRITATVSGPSAEGEASRTLQDGTSADLIFPVARIIADLSQVVTLYPGDLIFTGTPAGVGMARGLFLKPGDALTSEIEGLGRLENRFVAA